VGLVRDLEATVAHRSDVDDEAVAIRKEERHLHLDFATSARMHTHLAGERR